MLDPNSRYMIVTKLHEERQAEARRSHILRAAREEEERRAILGRVVRPSPSLRSRIATVLGAVRHAANPDGHLPAH